MCYCNHDDGDNDADGDCDDSDDGDFDDSDSPLSSMRADEPTGYHPTRLWCRTAVLHVDALKTPIHEASESGQLGVLRTFVNNNISTVLARDGYGLTPLNIALRRRQKVLFKAKI